MNIQKNVSYRYDLLTKNYIPWRYLNVNNDTCKQIFSELDKTNAVDEFYNSSKSQIDNFIENFRSSSKNNKTIVYITGDKCYPMLLRQARLMKNNGFKTFLINMNPLKINDLESLRYSFIDIIQNCTFFPVLGQIIDKINPNYFHVQCWMWSYYLGKFIIKKKKKISKVICDFYDVTGMYSDRKSLKIIWDDFIVDQDLENEKFIFKNADGIIHRYKEKVFLEYSKRYNRSRNILEFQQYPVKSVKTQKKINNGKLKFVFCGTLIPPNDVNHPKELFNATGLINAFTSILELKHELYIYLPINGSQEFNKWIYDLRDIFFPETLKIFDSLPLENLIDEISHYDFGINIQKIDMESTKLSEFSYKGAMGTKNYTYLEAGLPILVNDEYLYCKELVEKHNIGLAIKSKDFSDLDLILKKYNISDLKDNVRKFNINNNLYEKSKELLEFYKSL